MWDLADSSIVKPSTNPLDRESLCPEKNETERKSEQRERTVYIFGSKMEGTKSQPKVPCHHFCAGREESLGLLAKYNSIESPTLFFVD